MVYKDTKELKDLIGRDETIDKINFLVETMPTKQNFCLALNGEWGSGKTHTMRLLEKKLRMHDEYIIVKYDAWKNNFYQDPLIAILYCILDTIEEEICYTDTLEKKFKKFKKSLKKSLISFLNDANTALAKKGGENGRRIALGYYVLKKIAEIIKETNASILNNPQFDDFKSYQDLLLEAQGLLNELTNYPLYEGKQTKLIILVDEIDRCLPNEQLAVLERLHHLFEIENCAVIVALNKASIIENFKNNYGDGGKEYLKKFFDYNFELKSEVDVLLLNKLKESMDALNARAETKNILTVADVKYIYDSLVYYKDQSAVNFDDRECDRYISRLEFVLNQIDQQDVQFYHVWFTVVMTFLKLHVKDQFKMFLDGKKTGELYQIPEIMYDRNYCYSTIHAQYDIRSGLTRATLNFPIYTEQRHNVLNHLVNRVLFRDVDYGVVDRVFRFNNIPIKWNRGVLLSILQTVERFS